MWARSLKRKGSGRKNEVINEALKTEAKKNASIVQILLLGPGHSGKSTLLRRMRYHYDHGHYGFPDSERAPYIPAIHNQIISGMATLARELSDRLMEDVRMGELQRFEREMRQLKRENAVIDQELANKLKAVWNDRTLQRILIDSDYGHGRVPDSLIYFMPRIDEIASPKYSPLMRDIFSVLRRKPSAIVEEKFDLDGRSIMILDPCGQRNESKKWLHQFEHVQVVIFVAAINDYNVTYFSDNYLNPLEESLDIFRRACKSRYLADAEFILFLNKQDLFMQKLPILPFRRVVDGPGRRNVDFQGPHCVFGTASSDIGSKEFKQCVSAAQAYIADKYRKIYAETGKELFVHNTDISTTKHLKVIVSTIAKSVLKKNINLSGLVELVS